MTVILGLLTRRGVTFWWPGDEISEPTLWCTGGTTDGLEGGEMGEADDDVVLDGSHGVACEYGV